MQYSVDAVRRRLRRLIVDGYFLPEEPLPSIQKLAKIFDVSLVTLQTVIHGLREEGLVRTRRGSGVFVQFPPRRRARGREVLLITSLAVASLGSEPYPALVMNALRKSLLKDGYRLKVVSLRDQALPDDFAFLKNKALAGVVLLEVESPVLIEALRDCLLPVVSMDFDLYRNAIASAIFDNLHAGFMAARRLLQSGHRRVAFARKTWSGLRLRCLVGEHAPVDSVTDDRQRGCQLALQDAGLDLQQIALPDHFEPSQLHESFARKSAPSALICNEDALAVEIAAVLAGLGYECPTDISLIGLGGTDATLPNGSRLTSVQMDFAKLGCSTAELFRATIDGASPRRIVLPVRLTEGESIAPVATAPAHIASTPR